MNNQIGSKAFRLVMSLLLSLSFILGACSLAVENTPTPDTSPVTLLKLLDRWHENRLVPDAALDVPVPTEGDPISYVMMGQQSMVNGDMRTAVDYINKSIEIDSEMDIPHYLLADVMYRLAFFDLIDRGKCKINMTPIENVPELQLRNGHLQIEIMELVASGRPAVYQNILSAQGIDEASQLRVQFYIISFVEDMVAGQPNMDEILGSLGGPPETIPMPECTADERSLPFLRETYNEILLAQKSKIAETPGISLVQKDRIANLALRLQVMLGEDVVAQGGDLPTTENMQNLPSVMPSVLTDPEVTTIIVEILDKWEAQLAEKGGALDMYGELFPIFEDQLANEPTNVMARLNLAYIYDKSLQYRKALDHYVVAAEQDPDLADPLIGLGRVYYELAIIDMVQRDLATTASNGTVVFRPDERTKKLLLLAKKSLLASKDLDRLLQQDENGNQTYVSPPGTEDEFLEMIENHLSNIK